MVRYDEAKSIREENDENKSVFVQNANIKKEFIIVVNFFMKSNKADFLFEFKINKLNEEAAKKEIFDDLAEKFLNDNVEYIFNEENYEMISKNDVLAFTIEKR